MIATLARARGLSIAREQGADVRDVQAALGHASLQSTSIYLPFSDAKRLRKIMDGRWYGASHHPDTERT